MTSLRHALATPVVAIVGVVAGALLAVWAGAIVLTGGSVAPTNVAVLVVGELSVLVAAVAVASTTGSDLEPLERAARELEAGEVDADALPAELPTDRDDEVGSIAGTIATLAEDVEDAERRAATNRQRAEERAAELSALSAALTAHAEAFEAAMERAAQGDLTARIEAQYEANEAEEAAELEALASEFDAMLSNIEETTDRLKRFASDVATHGEEVTASAEEVQHASEQVSTSVQEISDTTETQSQTFERVADRIDELAATTQAIAGRAESVSQIAERTAETGERGREAARDAAMAMESIDESSASATEEMDELEALVDEIDEVAEFIAEIAEEVNVLALNANIEASRSAEGDSEGFAVVAKEVKDLAAETKFSAEHIENLVGEVKVQTELSASEVQSTRDAVTEGRATVDEAIDALEEIAGYAADTHRGVLEITNATDKQAKATDDVVNMVDHAASLSREVDGEAGTVAAAAEQQTSALTEVSQGTDELSTEAQALRAALDRFDTDVEPDDASQGWLPDPPSPPAAADGPGGRSDATEGDVVPDVDSTADADPATDADATADATDEETTPDRTATATPAKTDGGPPAPGEREESEDLEATDAQPENAEPEDDWPGEWSSTASRK